MCCALWSINERLAGREGTDLEPPSLAWTGELLALMAADARNKRPDPAGLE